MGWGGFGSQAQHLLTLVHTLPAESWEGLQREATGANPPTGPLPALLLPHSQPQLSQESVSGEIVCVSEDSQRNRTIRVDT